MRSCRYERQGSAHELQEKRPAMSRPVAPGCTIAAAGGASGEACIWPSSWTATGVGPSGGACRGPRTPRGRRRAAANRGRGRKLNNVERLTVFGFSTENWRRPEREVSELMGLIKAYFESDRRADSSAKASCAYRRTADGARSGNPQHRRGGRSRARRTIAASSCRWPSTMAGRADIVDAAREFAREVASGQAALPPRTSTSGVSKVTSPRRQPSRRT